MGESKLPKGTLTPAVARYITQHPGVVFTLDDLVDATGGRPETIQVVVNKLRQSMPVVEVISTGRVWRYLPRPQQESVQKEVKVTSIGDNFRSGVNVITRGESRKSSGRRVFEEIGTANDGSLIIESDAGTLYTATELGRRS